MEFQIPQAAAGAEDSGTVYVRISPSGKEPESLDSATVLFTITPSGVDQTAGTPVPGSIRGLMGLYVSEVAIGTEYTDASTVYVDVQVSGVEFKQILDASTVPLTITPSSTQTFASVDSSTAYVTITPFGAQEGFDSGTVYFDIRPSTTVEYRLEFDTLLVGVLSRNFSASLEDSRRFDGSLTSKYSGMLTATRRFSASLSDRRYSAALTNRWAGILGRM